MIDFHEVLSPLLPSDLDEVEREFGFKFPAEFREHYLRFNGGYPDRDRFVDAHGICTVQEFLPIKYGKDDLTLEHSLRQIRLRMPLFPSYLIQFAVDPGGNYYCFSTRSSDYAAIYMVRMDANHPSPEYLAPSLTDFLRKLTAKEEPIPMSDASEVNLWYEDINIASIGSPICGDGTWSGRSKWRITGKEGVIQRRIAEFVRFSEEWNERAKNADDASVPDPAEFDVFKDVVSGSWTAVDNCGHRVPISVPGFFCGNEVSWRERRQR